MALLIGGHTRIHLHERDFKKPGAHRPAAWFNNRLIALIYQNFVSHYVDVKAGLLRFALPNTY